MECPFVRQVLLGESIAPFRLLPTSMCVIPMQPDGTLLDAAAARAEGWRYLARWLRDIEAKWAAHCSKGPDGTPRTTLLQQLNHMRKLTAQVPTPDLRVVYSKAGTILAAAIVADPSLLVDHKAYWASVHNEK